MAFRQKYLDDTFNLDGLQNIHARDCILREVIPNLLAHWDFSSGYVAKMVIEKERIYIENITLSHGHVVPNLATFAPHPDEFPISKVFQEITLADELGSGMCNTYKYTKIYSGGEPKFEESDIFRITVPLTKVTTATVAPSVKAVPCKKNLVTDQDKELGMLFC